MHDTLIADCLGQQEPGSWTVDFGNRILAKLRRDERLMIPVRHMGSVESRMNIFHFAMQVIEFGVPGDFVEVGCHAGISSVVLQKILLQHDPSRRLHLFDSFLGVPDVDPRDEGAYLKGSMATSRDALVANFREKNLPLPTIHEGWFDRTLPGGLPDQIAFAFIDGDLHASTQTALTHVYPRLVPHAVCMFGVYCDPTRYDPRLRSLEYRSPGVKKACDEFFVDKPEKVSVLYAGDYTNGYFRKR